MNQVHNVSTSTALYANTFNESKSEEKKRNEKKKIYELMPMFSLFWL